MSTLAPFLGAFLVTQLVEVPLYRRLAPTTIARAFTASLLTHPIVWFVFFSPRVPLVYEWKLALAEAFAVVVEAGVLVHGGVRTRRALALSFAANLTSVLVGEALRAAIDWP